MSALVNVAHFGALMGAGAEISPCSRGTWYHAQVLWVLCLMAQGTPCGAFVPPCCFG